MAVKETQKPENDQKPKDTAEAAVAEVDGTPEPRTITVRDKEFPIPNNQPSQILFSARQVSRATRTGDEGAAIEAMMDMAIAYIGEDTLHELLDSEDLETGMAIVEEILGAASASYGSDLGE